MEKQALIPHLFRTEYRKIVSVLCKLFGIEHIADAEDLVSDTFLQAAETWGQKGLPKNPTAWLYTVAKNKAIDFLRHDAVFNQKIAADLNRSQPFFETFELDLSVQNINDSQLQMMFAFCHPGISLESQIGLSLSILCGFGVEEIADAFLSTTDVIYKRLSRAKEKLRIAQIKIEMPSVAEINNRLDTVLTTMYLLFNEGYYSTSKDTTLRKDLCVEAMRLTYLLTENEHTNKPSVNALLSLMCFHTSRFEARMNQRGEIILYDDQDAALWNQELIQKGKYYLNLSSVGNQISKYHVEAAIAYWHTYKEDTVDKWTAIVNLYNKLLQIEYSPMAALNRTFALAKSSGKTLAIAEAEKLGLTNDHLYHALLGYLYTDVSNDKALKHYTLAVKIARTLNDKFAIGRKIEFLKSKMDRIDSAG